ncbi:MAG: hypothetical protein COZ75_06310 [Flavobacteriaceae bacterium CG_4_8_14_3_um_filter_34_10]|nr:MAG: hypothetical protein AUK33_11870 [Flavobacteriaceae bacterium CG2_30_34_30]PIQ17721.1 MAG: hypothetical protein COW66_09795 [Flavobacteriaceae bacterium CG18_big_fil_WC_8_21_14_2_50_34_36]PIV51451.1 MAG: hypothetical protein COS19_01065 [Flavobacteriaceae bacterium CG02_land_8_20_14_3_00_34_13]PIX09516.1 MAG: hypothetical protein COZ75_06310 [Flavobacteriaceae bacterium CG_4_8_14_3_um_filter_34_10]PIZ07760.1 MAG: hypothetical protein COY56_07555 [Flavobacteriaceae bacterium CG_4_10_14_0
MGGRAYRTDRLTHPITNSINPPPPKTIQNPKFKIQTVIANLSTVGRRFCQRQKSEAILPTGQASSSNQEQAKLTLALPSIYCIKTLYSYLG